MVLFVINLHLFSLFLCTLRRLKASTFVQEDDEAAKEDIEADKRVSDNADDARTGTDVSDRKLGVDHFNDEERDPKKSRAMSKSHIAFL